jgi:hypothetical protein
MALIRDFKETIRDRVQRDPKFRKELLREGLEAMLSGEIDVAKTILRDYINATVGFAGLAQATHIPPKSLMRMFGPLGIHAPPISLKSSASCSAANVFASMLRPAQLSYPQKVVVTANYAKLADPPGAELP